MVDYISSGASVADIGTDHGYLPVFLAQTGIAKRIIATDISVASLEAAKNSAKKYNVTDAIEFIVAPGLSAITNKDADTIVISGMGGETIIDILKAAPWTIDGNIKLILQPQTKTALLCRFLYDSAYKIDKTLSIKDRGKRYTIILCNSEKYKSEDINQ